MAKFNPLDYGSPVEEESSFNPLDYGEPVESAMSTPQEIGDLLGVAPQSEEVVTPVEEPKLYPVERVDERIIIPVEEPKLYPVERQEEVVAPTEPITQLPAVDLQQPIVGPIPDIEEPKEESTRVKLQGLKEVVAGTALGAATFVPANLTKYGVIGGYRLLDYMGLIPDDKKVSDEEFEKFKTQIDQATSNLGGLLEAKTKFGQETLEKIAVPFEALHEFASNKVRHIDKKKYPNLHEFATFSTEMIMFGFLGKAVRATKQEIKKHLKDVKVIEKTFEENVAPEMMASELIRKGVNKGVAKDIAKAMEARPVTARVTEKVKVEKDKPFVAALKEKLGYKAKEVEVGERFDRKVDLEVSKLEQLEGGKKEVVPAKKVTKTKFDPVTEFSDGTGEVKAAPKKKITPKETDAKIIKLKDAKQQKGVDSIVAELGSLEKVKRHYTLDDDVSRYARTKAAELYGGESGVEKLTRNYKPAPVTAGYEVQGRMVGKEGDVRGWNKKWQATRTMRVAAQKAGVNPTEYNVTEGDNGWVFQRRKSRWEAPEVPQTKAPVVEIKKEEIPVEEKKETSPLRADETTPEKTKGFIKELDKTMSEHGLKFDDIMKMPEVMQDKPDYVQITMTKWKKPTSVNIAVDKLSLEEIKRVVEKKQKEFGKDALEVEEAPIEIKEIPVGEEAPKKTAKLAPVETPVQVLGKPGYKKGAVVPWKMEHYAKKAAEKMEGNWEAVERKDGWVIEERKAGKKIEPEKSKIDVDAGKKEVKQDKIIEDREIRLADRRKKREAKKAAAKEATEVIETPQTKEEKLAAISKFFKDDPKAILNEKGSVDLTILQELGETLYTGSKQKYFDWQKQMKAAVGDAWGKVKEYLEKVWKLVKTNVKVKLDPIRNQRGSVDISKMSSLFGKSPKGDSLYSKLKKKGINENDLMLSGIGGYLKGKGRERISWEKLKEIANESGFGVVKESSGGTPGANVKGYIFDPRFEDTNYNLKGAIEDTYGENLYKYEPITEPPKGFVKRNSQLKTQVDIGKITLEKAVETLKKEFGAADKDSFMPPDFQEAHWGKDGANVLAHERGHDRVVDGDKEVRYVDELQSKWHDRGRSEGYGAKTTKEIEKEIAAIKETLTVRKIKDGEYFVEDKNKTFGEKVKANSKKEAIDNYDYASHLLESIRVPNAPFKKTWPEMIMRDVVADAVARGKDGVAWSTGKIQQERWKGAKTDYAALYDNKLPKFFKKEFGVKVELVETEAGGITKYEIVHLPEAYNEWAVVNYQTRDNLGQFKTEAKAKLEIKKLEESENLISIEDVWYVPITDKMKKMFGKDSKVRTALDELLAPLQNEKGAITLPFQTKEQKAPKEYLGEDFSPFELKEGEAQVNIGKEANKNIKVGVSDAKRFVSLIPTKSRTAAVTPTEYMFDKYPQIRNLLDQTREVDKVITKEAEEFSKKLKVIEKKYSSKSKREQVGINWHYANKSGKEAMEALKHEKSDVREYSGLREELQPLFTEILKEVNKVRVKLGKKAIKLSDNYLTFYAVENYMTDFMNLTKGQDNNNVVLDDAGTIQARQGLSTKDSAAFAHVKREGLRDEVKLELDPLVIINRYAREALNHIHKSPLIAFTREMIKADLYDPVTGKKISIGGNAKTAASSPTVAADISSWINKWAGKSNVNLPKSVERIGQKVMDNLTTAQLLGSLRTTIVQSAALVPTAVRFGYYNTFTGSMDALFTDKVGESKVPYEKSNSLPTASWDVAADNMGNAIGKSKTGKIFHAVKETSAFLMQGVDYLARKMTFGTAYRSALPLVEAGKLTEKQAIRIADAEVIRTQGSGSITEISPIQRNVLGKMATLWQTHTINQANFFFRDVLGISGKKLPKGERAMRIFRTLFGVAMMTLIYEEIMGIQSPFPAPSSAIRQSVKENDNVVQLTRKLILELSEGLPFGGSVKFGSDILGPIAKHTTDIVKAISGKGDFNQDLLTSAFSENEKVRKRARIKIIELIGKTTGIPGTSQWAKFVRGRLRGESIPRAAVGRIYNKEEGGSTNSMTNALRTGNRKATRSSSRNALRTGTR